jgi:RNA recognition motif-containing protein
MAMKLYVGNLPWATTEEQLEKAFSDYGEVTSVNIITDRETGQSRGFGFVEMASGGSEAMEAMNGTVMGGRPLRVNEAQPRR